jgi:hypothetical protein
VSSSGVRSAIIVLALSTLADARVVMTPAIQRMCRGPSTWAQIAKCARPYARSLAEQPRATVELVVDQTQTYVFIQGGDAKWRLQSSLRGGTYELVGRSKVKVAATTSDRVELRDHYESTWEGRRVSVFRKTALVCAPDSYCAEVIYACTAMAHGRALETFAGEVMIGSDGSLNVVGDHSQSGTFCR